MLHALSDSLRVDFHPKKKINDFYFDAWLTVIIQFRDVKTIFFLFSLPMSSGGGEQISRRI